MAQPAEQQDFREYLRALWRWKFLFLAFLVVVPAISYVLESRKTVQYHSSTLVQIQAISLDPSLFGGQSVGSSENLQAVARLVQTSGVAKAAAKLMHPPAANPGALLGEIEVEPDVDTGFLTIGATDPDPRRAADVANAFALAISQNRSQQAIAQIDSSISNVQKQIAQLDPTDAVGKAQLSSQLQRLRTLKAAQGPSDAIIEKAVPSGAAVGRNTRRAVELGIVIALLLGIGAVAIAENSDRRIRSPEELEGMTDLPLLSAIPANAFTPSDDPLRDEEAFQMLRAALTYFNVGERLASVVITSPGQEDGKTTVAIRLAEAVARAGRRVILVDADLRRPQIGPRLGLRHDGGLGAVLVGEQSLSAALVDAGVQTEGGAETPSQGRLRVLPAGAPAPNPSEMLSSEEMQRVLRELEGDSDLVIVDSAAALAVSDALPLLQGATGVVLIARLNRTTRVGIARLLRTITAAGGNMLGVVATGAGGRPGYDGYGYGYGYRDSRARRRAEKKARKQSSVTAAEQPEREAASR